MSFIYNDEKNTEMSTDDIRQGLLEDGGLCPSCEKRVGAESLLASYSNDDGVYYYLICMKCVNMLNKLDNVLKDKKKLIIEENLNANIHIYAAALLNNNPSFSQEEENREVSVLNNFKSEWNQDDEKYFRENPDKKFRARKIFFGELEETYDSKPHLKNDASQKGIKYAIIHHLGNEQNLKSFVNDISAYPIDDESFVAALFIVLVQNIPVEKINDIYEDIKERKIMFNGLDSFKTFY
jgi:hypothetical protein